MGTMFDLRLENQTFEGLKSVIRVCGIWAVFDSGLEFQDFEDLNRVQNAIGAHSNACWSAIQRMSERNKECKK